MKLGFLLRIHDFRDKHSDLQRLVEQPLDITIGIVLPKSHRRRFAFLDSVIFLHERKSGAEGLPEDIRCFIRRLLPRTVFIFERHS